MYNYKLLIINGPGLSDLSNFNKYGYGHLTLEKLQKKCLEACKSLDLTLEFCQTDDETELSNYFIRSWDQDFDALIINPVGYSHSSTLVFDINTAIQNVIFSNKPVIEVHIANIFQQGIDIIRPIKPSVKGNESKVRQYLIDNGMLGEQADELIADVLEDPSLHNIGFISGFGIHSYELAIRAIRKKLDQNII
jgi:3-dehydroquinate dehydratase-2|tara:strand:+ start:288 stop:866 length:579 start_codon:yes stop_codon:yes gene_type:complete